MNQWHIHFFLLLLIYQNKSAMKKIIPLSGLITICLFLLSCEKNEPEQCEVAYVVTDESTGAPVEGARLFFLTDAKGINCNWPVTYVNNEGYSNKDGVIKVKYDKSNPYFIELFIEKAGYEAYRIMEFSHTNRTGVNRVALKTKNAFIKFHLNIQSPVNSNEIFAWTSQNISYSYYFYSDQIPLTQGTHTILHPVVPGNNKIEWRIIRNYNDISNSSSYVTVPSNGTADIQVDF